MNDRSTPLKLVVTDRRRTVQEAMSELAERHHDELMRILVSRLHHVEDAAELEQEAYARLLKYPERYTDVELRNLLFRIVGNLVTDHWRWRRYRASQVPLAPEHEAVPDEAPSQDRTVLSQQQWARLEAAILAMPEIRRAVFVLCRLKGLTAKEAAERCGISQKMAEKHIMTAVAECKHILEKTDEPVGKPPGHPLYTQS